MELSTTQSNDKTWHSRLRVDWLMLVWNVKGGDTWNGEYPWNSKYSWNGDHVSDGKYTWNSKYSWNGSTGQGGPKTPNTIVSSPHWPGQALVS